MGMLKDHRFWTGLLVGYLLLVIFPQLNVRSMLVKKS
jgi:hypothetical protein